MAQPAPTDVTAPLPQTAAPAPTPAASPTAPPASPPSSSGPSRSNLAAMVAAFVVLVVIGLFALTRIIGGGSDAEESSASGTSQGPPSASGGGATSSQKGSESPSQSASESQSASPDSPTPSRTGADIPAAARRCSTSGNDAVATAYAGTDRTSCEFAVAVREAYRRAGTPDGAATIRAYSPVTKKWYTLSCDGGTPVRCETSSNALILLAP